MELVVELSTGRVALSDVDDMNSFAVRTVTPSSGQPVDGDPLDVLAAALHEHSAGTVESEADALVPTSALRRLAAEAAIDRGRPLGPEWESDFAAMVEFAGTRGWLSDDGSIRAHIVWEN